MNAKPFSLFIRMNLDDIDSFAGHIVDAHSAVTFGEHVTTARLRARIKPELHVYFIWRPFEPEKRVVTRVKSK